MATLDDINTLPASGNLSLDDRIAVAEQSDRRSPKRVDIGDLIGLVQSSLYEHGMVNLQGNTTATDVVASSTFYETGVNGVLASSVTLGFEALTGGKFGLKYTTDATRTFSVHCCVDCTNGNNESLAIRLAKNGTSIANSESRTFTASGAGSEAHLSTFYLIELTENDTLSLVLANVNHTSDITVKRGTMVVRAV
jgi:type 1 fimbria pilin